MILGLLSRIIRTGVAHGATPTDKMRLLVVNTMTVAGTCLSVLLATIYIALGHYDSVGAAVFGVFICSVSQYLLARGYFSSIVVIVAGCDALIFVQHQLFHGLVPNHLFFFATATAPFVVFPPTQRRLAAFSCVIAFGLFLVSIAYPDFLFTNRPVPQAALIVSVTKVVWVTAFGFAIVPSFLLFNLVRRYQEEFLATQQSRMHSAKLAALGETAAGIAHEINNPLGVVCGKAEALLEELAESGGLEPTSAKERLEAIERNGRRISRIISSLRGLARQSGQDPLVKVCLKAVVDETVQLVSAQFANSGFRLTVDVPDDLLIACRASEIMQVITNILNNARDALAGSKGETKAVEITARRAESGVVLVIGNNGPEIPVAVRQRVFEPFFSTKPPNEGTGLGLSISSAIMASHGGSLRCDSTPAWTTFTMALPDGEGAS